MEAEMLSGSRVSERQNSPGIHHLPFRSSWVLTGSWACHSDHPGVSLALVWRDPLGRQI